MKPAEDEELRALRPSDIDFAQVRQDKTEGYFLPPYLAKGRTQWLNKALSPLFGLLSLGTPSTRIILKLLQSKGYYYGSRTRRA